MSPTRTAALLLALLLSPRAHGQLLGVDVSVHQGSVNWNSMDADGIAFGFAKATEGVDFVDDWFVENMNGARAAGVPIGPYHYGRPDSSVGALADPVKQDAVNEANDFVDQIEPYYTAYPGEYLRPVLDVEELPSTGEINTVSEQRQYLSDWIHDFVDVVVDRLGVEPIIYLNSDYANNYIESSVAEYDLWLARWTNNVNVQPTSSNLGVWDDWEFWQWTATWSAGGESPLDGNYFLGDQTDLEQYLVGVPPVTGDFNGDGVVDSADYTYWRDVSPLLDLTQTHPANVNGDNVVDENDYAIWAANYGASTGQATSVPEPASLALVALATLTALRGRATR